MFILSFDDSNRLRGQADRRGDCDRSPTKSLVAGNNVDSGLIGILLWLANSTTSL